MAKIRGSSGGFPVKTAVIVAVLLILVSALGVGFYKFNGNSLDLSDREVLLIPTSSMDGEPQDYPISTIPTGSLVMTVKIGPDDISDIKVGDVICFEYSGILLVHRVIEIDEANQKFITHGDNNDPGNNEMVPFSSVSAKVIGVSEFLGKVVDFVKSSTILAIAGIAVLIVMVMIIIDIVRIIREDDSDEEEVPEEIANIDSHEDVVVLGKKKD